MRRMVMVTGGRKRRPITRRDWRSIGRGRGRSRVWIGSRARAGASRPFFFARRTQQMRRPRPSEWLGAAAMLLGVASWGVLAALLAA
jgi:hypothetical protein